MPPLATVTGPLTVPVPPNVAPLLTLIVVVAEVVPVVIRNSPPSRLMVPLPASKSVILTESASLKDWLPLPVEVPVVRVLAESSRLPGIVPKPI